MKKKILPVVLLAIMCACFFAACVGDPAEAPKMSNITWTVDDKATVTVTDFDSLPASVETGTTVSFTVEAATGYTVDKVMANNKTLYTSKGAYSTAVREDTTIVVRMKRIVESLAVTTNPEDLTYFVGEQFSNKGMVIKATYATGEVEAITDYSVFPVVFEGGETSVQVSFGEKSVDINLASPVEYIVKINTNGGTISEDVLDTFSSQNNYSVNAETGEISFSYYKNIEGELLLPTAETITKTNYDFVNWTDNVTSISNDTASNLTLAAVWNPKLVTISSVQMEIRTVEGTKVPYLIVDGTFVAADEAYLYLYEGNDKVEIKGPTVTRGETNASFELLFDLRDLSKLPDYKQKWMDIRFNAALGDKEESQKIFIPSENIDVNPNSFISLAGINYIFTTFADQGDGGNHSLKLFYNTVNSKASYSFDMVEDKLVVTGKIVDETVLASAKGGKAIISWWNGATESLPKEGIIAADGSFSITIDPIDIIFDTTLYVHFTVKNTEDSIIYGGTTQNLLHYGCTNKMNAVTEAGNLKSAAKFTSTSGVEYYVGFADIGEGGGIVIYAIDKSYSFSITGAKVETIDGKPNFVISGDTSLTAADFEEGGRAASFLVVIVIPPVRLGVQKSLQL